MRGGAEVGGIARPQRVPEDAWHGSIAERKLSLLESQRPGGHALGEIAVKDIGNGRIEA